MKFGPLVEIDQREKATLKLTATMAATRGKRNTEFTGKLSIPEYILQGRNPRPALRRKRQAPTGIAGEVSAKIFQKGVSHFEYSIGLLSTADWRMETELSGVVSNNKRLKEVSAMLKTNNRTLAAARAAVKTAANKAKDVHDIFFGLSYPRKMEERPDDYEIVKSAISGNFKQGKSEQIRRG